MVIIRNHLEKNDGGSKDYKLTFCAEPSPDVGEAFSAAVAASLNASLTTSPGAGPEASAAAAGAFARELATQISPLLYRTQGLQLYRDAQFGLCNDVMSGYIDPDEYLKLKQERFNQAASLIALELPGIAEARKKQVEAVTKVEKPATMKSAQDREESIGKKSGDLLQNARESTEREAN